MYTLVYAEKIIRSRESQFSFLNQSISVDLSPLSYISNGKCLYEFFYNQVTVVPIESMLYIPLLSIAALFSSVIAFPKTTNSDAALSPIEKGLVIARELDDSVLATADTDQIFDSTTLSELPTDKPTELTSSITDDEYSSNGFTVALHKDT